MPMQSDIRLDAAKFAPSSVNEKTTKFNDHLIQILENGPRWYEVHEFSCDSRNTIR